MPKIYAIDIELPVETKGEAITYMGLTEDQHNFLLGCVSDKKIIGFEWLGKGELGVILAKKK